MYTLLSDVTGWCLTLIKLCAGDFHTLMEITKMVDFEGVLSNNVQSSFEHCTDVVTADSVLRQPNLEPQLLITHGHLITQQEKETDDFQTMPAVAVSVCIKESL